MEKLTQIEKEAIAFLIRQEINEGEKTLDEVKGKIVGKEKEEFAKGLQLYMEICSGFYTRKRRFEEIARKLEIEL